MAKSTDLNICNFKYLGIVKTIKKISSNQYLITEQKLYIIKFDSTCFYRLHIEDKDIDYHVTLGEYKFGGELYNAKAGEYYFNI